MLTVFDSTLLTSVYTLSSFPHQKMAAFNYSRRSRIPCPPSSCMQCTHMHHPGNIRVPDIVWPFENRCRTSRRFLVAYVCHRQVHNLKAHQDPSLSLSGQLRKICYATARLVPQEVKTTTSRSDAQEGFNRDEYRFVPEVQSGRWRY